MVRKLASLSRRTLISLILILVIVLVVILICLWGLLQPGTPQEGVESSALRVEWPSASTAVPDNPRPTTEPAPVQLFVGPLVAGTNTARLARMFDEEQALEHIAYLADDELGGRQPGTPGGRAAGDYIAAQFAEYGLEPAGVGRSYFQTFTVPYGQITSQPVFTIISPGGKRLTSTYTYRTDFRALTGGYLGAGEGEGPVVWLNECLHNDYAGLDMIDKIVLCRYTGNPEVYRQAIEHQVGGVLLVDRMQEDVEFRRGGYRETAWVPQTIPAYMISEDVANDLLSGTDYTLDELSFRFTATPLSTTVRLAVTVEEQDKVKARNVLALLPGSDPIHGEEVVVFGAHYDHLGPEPDGTIMNGANDNASGVATMMEIARLWHAQGFRPSRSVLFAAWDGEEQGLLGSRHYVENPTLPLTQTAAMLNLDMVGAGEILQIDGEGSVAAQLQTGAEAYGITYTVTFMGRSDHMTFHRAGVDSAMLIYWPDTYYHTPDDEIDTVRPEKVKAVGAISAHTLATLAEGHIELAHAVERLRASIATGNREAFLEGLDPTDPNLQTVQAAWFDNLWSRGLTDVTIEPRDMRVGDGEAEVTLRTAYRWAKTTQTGRSISYDAQFVQRDGVWYFAGYRPATLAEDVITVGQFAELGVEINELLSTTQETYVSLATGLGLEPVRASRFIYYPDAATMRAVARPAASRDTRWLVPSAGLVEIAWGEAITPAAVSLILNQMGLPPDEGSWLREGLTLQHSGNVQRRHLPTLVATRVLTPLLDFPPLDDLPEEEARPYRARAWSATEYLLSRYGNDGLQALCALWGETGDPQTAFQRALGLSPSQFESAWRASRVAPLEANAEAIDSTIAARAKAVLAGDESGFLATVDSADPTLRTEESHWFANLSAHPVSSYTVTKELVDWSPERNEAIVALRVNTVISGEMPAPFSYDARFVQKGNHWVYADVAWNELFSQHFILRHQIPDRDWAKRILDLAEAAYDQVTTDLDMTPRQPVEIKIYENGPTFLGLLSSPASNGGTSHSEAGEAIKLWLEENNESAIQKLLAHELTLRILVEQGLETAWLLEGVASFETDRVRPLGTHWGAAQRAPTVQEAVRRHWELPLEDLFSFEDVPQDEMELAHAQSWSLVSYIVEEYGLPELRRLVTESIADNTITALRTGLDVDPASFVAEWQEYARTEGLREGLVSLAQRFDPERALGHISILSSPEFGGREAGTPGADLTADYIADRFAAVGLEPLGDLPAASAGSQATVTNELDIIPRGYLQRLPISHTHLIDTPALTLLDKDGAVIYEFAYREDFFESAGDGTAHGELVWLHTEDVEEMSFGGAIVLKQDVDDPAALATRLQHYGAGGLIVVTDKEPKDFESHYVRPDPNSEGSIPVFDITRAAFETLLEQLGMEYRDLTFAPSALPLNVQMEQTLLRLPVTTTLTANVLGLMPGTDPDLADEVLIVGAHYDHIGQSPDGLTFPGANQNASGVGALLEMAQVWRSTGFRPARSVLFAAWSGEELGSAGVSHYLDHPAVPLTQTVGVIALDSIGNGRGYRLVYYGMQKHDLPLVHRVEASTAQLSRRAQRRVSTGEGWHTYFNSAGIPTVKLIWDEAERDYYLPTDTPDLLDLERLAFSGEVLTLSVSWLAGW
jgi:Zn-dependent M28 family amino/carboxypeptidase